MINLFDIFFFVNTFEKYLYGPSSTRVKINLYKNVQFEDMLCATTAIIDVPTFYIFTLIPGPPMV